jgi:DNA replication protein
MKESASLQNIIQDQIQIPAKLLTSYKIFGMNELEVMVILQIHRFLMEGKEFPTPGEISSSLTIEEKECANILRMLIQKKFLAIEQSKNDQSQLSEAYCLNPLWEKLYTNEDNKLEETADGTIFILFEQEFGRPLSPFEIETINAWLDADQIAPSLIKAGLRESVLMGKLNFKYIDRILRDWQKKGIHSVEQAREASKSYRNPSSAKNDGVQKRDTSFYYNWLESEE